MTWALGVVSLVALGLAVQCWRMRKPWQRAGHEMLASIGDERTLLRARAQAAEQLLDRVRHALPVVWHHVLPATAVEGEAVGVLRDVFRGLTIPGKPRMLDRDKVQAMLGAMLRRAEAAKRSTEHIGEHVRTVTNTHCFTLREVMGALHLDLPEERTPEPPAHVLIALSVLNEAVTADADAVRALLSTRMPCNDALARHPTIQVRREATGHSVSAFGLINGILGAIPSGPAEGWGWLSLETEGKDGPPLRFVLTPATTCAWCGARAGDGTRPHGGELLPVCAQCLPRAAQGEPPAPASMPSKEEAT